MNRWLLYFLLTGLLVSGRLMGNNVRINGEPDVQLNATSDSLSLTFTLSWDNSWRDNFNWDAVWLFVKYKKEGSTDAWSHLYLGTTQVGTANLNIETGNTGSQIVGAFVYPKNKGTFNIAGERVTLKAPLNGLSTSDITEKRVYFAVSAIEMVLIPYGSYYLGDGESNHTFKSYNIPMIPPEADIIGTSSEFSYSCEPEHHRTAYAFNAADRISYTSYDERYTLSISEAEHGKTQAPYNNNWIVDFGSSKTILSFGVSIPNYSDVNGDYFPSKDWYLLGSGDGFTWDTLQRCDPFWVTKDANSYPVRRAIRVSSPGAYRYYRLFFPEMNGGYGNGFMLNNVAMSERDLYPNGVDEYKYITSEDAIIWGSKENNVVDGLYADDGTTWSGTLPATYPKGYKGFYIMKYELSQEQYCNFLNMLNYTQQKNRIGNNLDNLARGDYVFGNKNQPSCRNGIAVFSHKGTSQPVVFGCNLNPAEPFFDKDDGQTVACNYMTGADMLSYLDWSGLRPMSELEYEKACRTPSRVVPGEYAWNTTSATPLGGLGGLSTSTIGTENEVPVNNNMNVNSGAPTFGPVRCGSFGTSSTNQEQSGGSFYGVMEMSGNLGEMYYSVKGGSSLNTNPTSASNNEYHGDGSIAATGDFNVPTYWNRSSEVNAFSVRGGSFASPNSFLRVSDRRVLMNYDNTNRDSTVTFRGGRSLNHVLDPGQIGSDATCPGLVTINSIQDAQGDADLSYVWYVKRQGKTTFELIEGEHGAELVNYDLVSVGWAANVTYTFRREAVSLTDEAYVDFTLIVPNMLWQINSTIAEINTCSTSNEFEAVSIIGGAAYEWKYNGNVITTNSIYVPSRPDFNGVQGTVNMECIISRAGCSNSKQVVIHIDPPALQTFRVCGDNMLDCEGNAYSTVLIGSQCWMGENINVGDFKAVGSNDWHTKAGMQKHCYNDNLDYCKKYGGLYRWEEAMYGGGIVREKMNGNNVQGICPDGWHIPSQEEWVELEVFLGMARNVAEALQGNFRGTNEGTKLKKSGIFEGYEFCSGVNCNESGFNGVPGGYRQGGYASVGDSGRWWASTTCGSGAANYRGVARGANGTLSYCDGKYYLYSIRCLKD